MGLRRIRGERRRERESKGREPGLSTSTRGPDLVQIVLNSKTNSQNAISYFSFSSQKIKLLLVCRSVSRPGHISPFEALLFSSGSPVKAVDEPLIAWLPEVPDWKIWA